MPDPSNESVRDRSASPTTAQPVQGGTPNLNPGDEAAAGTVGTGEDTCPRCGGSGKLSASQDCPDCDGSGIIIQGIGGG